jgi:hypothetical protein
MVLSPPRTPLEFRVQTYGHCPNTVSFLCELLRIIGEQIKHARETSISNLQAHGGC